MVRLSPVSVFASFRSSALAITKYSDKTTRASIALRFAIGQGATALAVEQVARQACTLGSGLWEEVLVCFHYMWCR